MRFFKAALLILGILVYIVIGACIRALIFFAPALSLKALTSWTLQLDRYLCFILNIRVSVEGETRYLKERGNFIISNHLGYLDGVVLGSLLPVLYISKAQARNWPLFGWMSVAGKTIFIDRQHKEKTPDYIREATQALKNKANLLCFPEGTSTNGEKLLAFQPVHFQSALDAPAAIIPAQVSYLKIGKNPVNRENRDKLSWYGQVNIFEHVRGVLRLRGIEVRVKIFPKVKPEEFFRYDFSRRNLSEALYKLINSQYPVFS